MEWLSDRFTRSDREQTKIYFYPWKFPQMFMAEVLIEISCIILVYVECQNSATIAYLSWVHWLSWIIDFAIFTQNIRRLKL